jgi:CheY-like chemotaxis protein
MPSNLVLLCGPPLPGRWRLARAIEERAGARRLAECCESHVSLLTVLCKVPGTVVADGDLATRAERRALLAVGAAERLLVDWTCSREVAARECFHRYASRPDVLAEREWQRYSDDAEQREPVSESELAGRVVRVDATQAPDEAAAALLARLPSLTLPATSGARKRVLVVEDDHAERQLLGDVLRELGYSVELAPDAGVALALLDEGPRVDLMVTDQQMPGMSGIELTRILRRRHPAVRCILLTAYGDERTCLDAVDADAVTLLEKPLRVCDLERVLDEATARSCPIAP